MTEPVLITAGEVRIDPQSESVSRNRNGESSRAHFRLMGGNAINLDLSVAQLEIEE